jgi:hypothetical protein
MQLGGTRPLILGPSQLMRVCSLRSQLPIATLKL